MGDCVEVTDEVTDAVALSVPEGVAVWLGVPVPLAVLLGVTDGVLVSEGVAVTVPVSDAVRVGVAELLGVSGGVAVLLAVMLGVIVGVRVSLASRRLPARPRCRADSTLDQPLDASPNAPAATARQRRRTARWQRINASRPTPAAARAPPPARAHARTARHQVGIRTLLFSREHQRRAVRARGGQRLNALYTFPGADRLLPPPRCHRQLLCENARRRLHA